MTKIKICGLFREEDISYVNVLMPDYVGFIINFPKSHRSLDYERARRLISQLNDSIQSVCVFVNQPLEVIVQFAQICDIIQLHGKEDEAFILKLRECLPEKEIWQAFKIKNKEEFTQVKQSKADRILLDHGYGTGEMFDWRLIEDTLHGMILAGGINCENIMAAKRQFDPEIIDVSSGVETDKVKDYFKIKEIIEKVRSEANG